MTANCVYNFIPDNQVPIIETRLTEEGRGYAEIGGDAQKSRDRQDQRNDASFRNSSASTPSTRRIATSIATLRLHPACSFRCSGAFDHHEMPTRDGWTFPAKK